MEQDAQCAGAGHCAVAEIPHKGVREMVFGQGYDCLRVRLVRSGWRVRAYRNQCAHVQIPLSYYPPSV
ncbi:MAG: hypothetical protein ABI619_00045 [Betaproteobacteria bacterium]